MNEMVSIYYWDEDGYFDYDGITMYNPMQPDTLLIPDNATTKAPALDPAYFYKWDAEAGEWVAEPKPTKPEDFIGTQISHLSQTPRNQELRAILSELVDNNPNFVHTRAEDGSWHFVEAVPEKTEDEKALEAAEQEERELLQRLAETDYVAAKIAEGAATPEEYSQVLEQRQAWRDRINELRALQVTLTANIQAATE